jgi:hypothetical protein
VHQSHIKSWSPIEGFVISGTKNQVHVVAAMATVDTPLGLDYSAGLTAMAGKLEYDFHNNNDKHLLVCRK